MATQHYTRNYKDTSQLITYFLNSTMQLILVWDISLAYFFSRKFRSVQRADDVLHSVPSDYKHFETVNPLFYIPLLVLFVRKWLRTTQTHDANTISTQWIDFLWPNIFMSSFTSANRRQSFELHFESFHIVLRQKCSNKTKYLEAWIRNKILCSNDESRILLQHQHTAIALNSIFQITVFKESKSSRKVFQGTDIIQETGPRW